MFTLGERWAGTCHKAFMKLKEALTSAPVLGFADYSKPFIVETDACDTGLGAVLSQKQEDGRLRVIAYASRGLHGAEKNSATYSSKKLELLPKRQTAEELNLLRVRPPNNVHAYSVTTEGADADIRHEFADIFQGVGKLKDFQLKLHVDNTVQPISQPVRRIPFGLRAKVDDKLDELLQLGIIEEVPSSSLVVVGKPGGDIRICVDMRRANEAVVRETPNSGD